MTVLALGVRLETPAHRGRRAPRIVTRPVNPAGTRVRSSVPRSGNYRGGSGFHGVLWQLWLPGSTAEAESTAQMGTVGL